MHEAAERRRLRAARLEQADLVAHRAVAEMADAQAGLDLLRKGEGRLVAAGALGADADHDASVDVEPTRADQVGVDRRVEVGVVDHVVHVAVDVVVHPARRDGEEVREAGASLRRVGHGWRTVRSASRVSSGFSASIMWPQAGMTVGRPTGMAAASFAPARAGAMRSSLPMMTAAGRSEEHTSEIQSL